METGIDTGGCAGRGEDGVLVDVEHARFDLGSRIAFGERVGISPVGGAAASVQQSGGAEDEGADADADDPGSVVDRLAQALQEGWGKSLVWKSSPTGMAIRSASAIRSRPWGVLIVNPGTARTDEDSAATSAKS